VEPRGSSAVLNRSQGTLSNGTVLFAYQEGSSNPALVTLDGNISGVRGLRVFYPNNGFATADSWKEYPYATRIDGVDDAYVVNVAIENGYQGVIAEADSDRHYIQNVVGATTHDFIRIWASREGWIEVCHSNLDFWLRNDYGITPWMEEAGDVFWGSFVNTRKANDPGMGYRTFAVKPITEKKFASPKTMCTGPHTMENETLVVSINANGTLDIYDKRTTRHYRGLGYLRDSGETGDPWTHTPPTRDTLLTTLNEPAAVSLIRDGELETAFRVSLNWALPAGRTPDDQARSDHYQPYPIVTTITLRKGQPWVEVITEIDNTVEDHYLRVSFPTGIETDDVQAQGQFDVLSRPVQVPDASLFDEPPIFEYPMNSFIDVSDGQVGLALLNEGLKAYETHVDAEHMDSEGWVPFEITPKKILTFEFVP
jgi:hypothetical protein